MSTDSVTALPAPADPATASIGKTPEQLKDQLAAYAQDALKSAKKYRYTLQDGLSVLLLAAFGAIYMNDQVTTDDLAKVSGSGAAGATCAAAITSNKMIRFIALVGALLCLLRILVHRLIQENPVIDLAFSLIAWGVFLWVMLSANKEKKQINDCINATNPTPTNPNKDILTLALAATNRELTWAVLGFSVTTAYTAYNIYDVYESYQTHGPKMFDNMIVMTAEKDP